MAACENNTSINDWLRFPVISLPAWLEALHIQAKEREKLYERMKNTRIR